MTQGKQNHAQRPIIYWKHRANKRGKKWAARSPKLVLEATEKAGGICENCLEEDLCILQMTYRDPAWEVFKHWIDWLDADPRVLAIFAPSAQIVNTSLVPKTGLAVLNEANSIINHYFPLIEKDFPNPNILGPIAAPDMSINVWHVIIALNGIFETILVSWIFHWDTTFAIFLFSGPM